MISFLYTNVVYKMLTDKINKEIYNLEKTRSLEVITYYYLHGLRVHGGDYAKVFCATMKEESAHPQVISHGDSLTWTNLELPLSNKC